MERICQREFNAQELVTIFPPRLSDRNKRIVFDMASPPGAVHAGTISFSRWRQMPLPETVTRNRSRPSFELREDFFTYDSSPLGQVDWHLNFADYDLFVAYGGSLFAQDEMQVAEHPALASLRHGIVDAGLEPVTAEDDIPSPVLIMGVERRCRISTEPNQSEDRPNGLYGNRFALAAQDVIRRATEIIDPPTISNILAMEAPSYGRGTYTGEQIRSVLSTALTGFSAAVFESKERVSTGAETTVHTGFWGCGAFGGNRVLMSCLQMIAACASDLNTLVFHSGADSSKYADALQILEEVLPVGKAVRLDELVSQIEGIGFVWGVGDGT